MLGKQAADLCTSTLTQYFVREYFGDGHWREYIESLIEIYRARRDAMVEALRRYFPPQATWTEPDGGLFIWATLPEYIDTSDLLAKALREDVAFVPGQAAYVDGRGRNSMRLNFSAGGEDEIREGIRRIGKVIGEQVELYGALTGEHPAPRSKARGHPGDGERRALPKGGGRVKVAVLKGGRSLERAVSLRSAARVEDALGRLGHEVLPLEADGELVKRLAAERPDVAFVAMHGPGGEDGTAQELLEILGIPFTGPGVAACIRCIDKVLAKHELRAAGIPTPDWLAFNETAFRELGAADALGGLEERLGFPLVVKPSRGGSALGVKFAESRDDVPGALVSAFSYDDRVLLERFVDGRELAVSVLGGEPLPVVEAIPRSGDGYDFEARYEIGRTSFVCPAQLGEDDASDGRRGRPGRLRDPRLLGLLPRRPDPRRRRPSGARGQRDPGPHRHQPPAPGRRGGRHVVRAAGREDPRPRPGADRRLRSPRPWRSRRG